MTGMVAQVYKNSISSRGGGATRVRNPLSTIRALLRPGNVLREWRMRITMPRMKTLTVRLPELLAAQIDADSRARGVSKSDVVRERLQYAAGPARRPAAPLEAIADLIGSVDGLPADLSGRKKDYLRTTGYGRKRPR